MDPIADRLIGRTLTDDQWTQLQLPGPLGGCGLRLPSSTMDAALWASWAAHEPAARRLSSTMQRQADHSGADKAAEAAAAALRTHGIIVEPGAQPRRTQEAHDTFHAGPWATEMPAAPRAGAAPRYMGATLQLLEGHRATQLWTTMSASDRTHYLSTGGSRTGMTWTAIPDAAIRSLPDAHWRCATLDRLNMLTARPGTCCGLPRAHHRGGTCGRQLDRRLRHVWHCRTAVARLRIHHAVNNALARELRIARGNVDVERSMPDMAKRKAEGTLEEAIMDLTVWFPGAVEWHGVDVTIRFPGAARYTGASYRPGRAATKAEEEKIARYGRDVLPIAYETGGRLGAHSTLSIKRLAQLAAQAAGGLTTPQSLETRWRRALEASLLFAIADAYILALGGEQAAELAKSQPTATHTPSADTPGDPAAPPSLTASAPASTSGTGTVPMHVDLEASMAELLEAELGDLFRQDELVAEEWHCTSQPACSSGGSAGCIAPARPASTRHPPRVEGPPTS